MFPKVEGPKDTITQKKEVVLSTIVWISMRRTMTKNLYKKDTIVTFAIWVQILGLILSIQSFKLFSHNIPELWPVNIIKITVSNGQQHFHLFDGSSSPQSYSCFGSRWIKPYPQVWRSIKHILDYFTEDSTFSCFIFKSLTPERNKSHSEYFLPSYILPT